MNRLESIDALVLARSGFYGDKRDRASPLADGLGDRPLLEAICYENFGCVLFLVSAEAYRRKLEALSDAALWDELEAARHHIEWVEFEPSGTRRIQRTR